MALPLYLAMTAAEMSQDKLFEPHLGFMACHFSPCTAGLSNIPQSLPEGAMLILNDRMPCTGHSPDFVVRQLADAVSRLGCESILLDFQRPADAESRAMVKSITDALPCPVAVSEGYAKDLACPVFLAPAPLHVPLGDHLGLWQGREIWLEAALCQEVIAVTPKGATDTPQFPPDRLDGGFLDENLCCRYRTEILESEVRFTLYDTRDSLKKKLEQAEALGVTRAVGLYQELGSLP